MPATNGRPGSPCAYCGQPLRNLSYRVTISGGARIVRLTDPMHSQGGMHRPCAEVRRQELDDQ